jgi:hypothetical protein
VKLKIIVRVLDMVESGKPLGCVTRDLKPPGAPPPDREAQLAEALRANLRRRKAAKSAPKPSVDEKRS